MDMIRLDPPAALTMPIGEAMFTQRATRRLDPDRPLSDTQIQTILDAASKAPSGANSQPARYLVIRDRATINEFGKLYFEAWWAKRRDAYGWTSKADIPENSVYRLPALLADEMVNAPAVILVYSEQSGVAESSTFPGVQNLLLAARAAEEEQAIVGRIHAAQARAAKRTKRSHVHRPNVDGGGGR